MDKISGLAGVIVPESPALTKVIELMPIAVAELQQQGKTSAATFIKANSDLVSGYFRVGTNKAL